MAKKEIIYQGLADLPVAIEDFSQNSPSYFLVTKLPTEFYAGPNIFKFKGNSSLFKEGEPIYVEILDSNGAPIYYEVGLDLESAEQSAIVSVIINEDTTPGTGYIILCGTVMSDVNGTPQDTSYVNVRWVAPITIDPSKRNETDIVYDELPEVTIVTSVGNYASPDYGSSSSRYDSVWQDNLYYYNYNNTAIIVTSSLSTIGFDTNIIGADVNITFLDITAPEVPNLINTETILKAVEVTSGYIVLDAPISETIYNSNSKWVPQAAEVSYAQVTYEKSGSLNVNSTENSFNVVTANFSNLEPQLGTVSKIRSYYKSTGVGEYSLINETDISATAPEFGFTPPTASVSFPLPTLQRNERIDFKFEFVNPAGYVSKQVIEALNNFFLGGNTYIGGDDNLLTGSLFVASSTGTGVQITGKNNSSLVRSLGYTGFADAISGAGQAGFVLYSGSISPIMGESTTNNYSGVGLELVANSDSYFRYSTANGGLLEIQTDKFFIGTDSRPGAANFISGSNGNFEILNKTATKTRFHLNAAGVVTASAFVAFTGSSDTNNFLMMDTSVGLIDGKNIGRIVFSAEETMMLTNAVYSPTLGRNKYTTTTSGLSTSALKGTKRTPDTTPTITDIRTEIKNYMTASGNWNLIFPDVSFYTLPFENTLTVFGNIMVDKSESTGSGATWNDMALGVALKFSLWAPDTTYNWTTFGVANSGSADKFIGAYSGTVSYLSNESTQTLDQLGTPVFATSNLSTSTYNARHTGSASARTLIPFKAVVPIDPVSGSDRLVALNMDYAFIRVTGAWNGTSYAYSDHFDFRCKLANLTAIIGRTLQATSTSGAGDAYASAVAGGYVPSS